MSVISTFLNKRSLSVSTNVASIKTVSSSRVRTGSVFLEKLQNQKSNYPGNKHDHSSHTYMNGVAIPNSVVRAKHTTHEEEDYESRRRSTAQELEKILRQFMPDEEDAEDSNLLHRIQRELERRRLVNRATQGKEATIDLQKEQRRISMRTSRLEPLACGRRSTCESIHRSIRQSEQIHDLFTDNLINKPIEDTEKDDDYNEVKTLSPPKKLTPKKGHQTKSFIKSETSHESTESPPPETTTKKPPSPTPAPVPSVNKRQKHNLDTNRKLNTKPWTMYVTPKTTESMDSFESNFFSSPSE